MENNEITDIYIVKTINTIYSDKKIINAIMDFSSNIICWDNADNAKKYILSHFDGINFVVERKNLKIYQNEIDRINEKYKTNTKLKIINEVEF